MEETSMQKTDRQDVYSRITGQIVADLEKGVLPYQSEHAVLNLHEAHRGTIHRALPTLL
jgi:antirestriction protein ArdC